MILKKIKLENIRSYINQTIEFPQGSVLLSGDIGSGKSTILFALEFALFGLKRVTLSGNTLLRNGAKEGSVEIHFTIDNKEIIVKRNLKRTSKDIKQEAGYIAINQIKSELTAVELKAKILQLLGYPMSQLSKSKDVIYRFTVYTPQEQMRQIIYENKDLRLDTLRKVFGIDKYKKVKENCAFYIRKLKEKINYQEGTILDLDQKQTSKKQKQEQITLINQKIQDLNPKIQQIQEQIKKKKQEIQENQEKLNQLNELKKQFHVFEMQLNEKTSTINKNNDELKLLEQEITVLNEKLNKFELKKPEYDTEFVEKQIELLNEQLKQRNILTERIHLYNKKITELAVEIDDKNNKLKDLDQKKQLFEKLEFDLKNKERIKQDIINIEQLLFQLNSKIKENEVKKESSEKLKKTVTDLENCPTCLQKVSLRHKAEITKKEGDKVRYFIQELKNLNTKKTIKTTELEKVKEDFEKLLKNETQFAQLKVEVETLSDADKEIQSKQERLDVMKKELSEYNEKIEKIKSEEQLQRSILDNKDVLKNIQNYQIKLKEKNFIQEKIKDKQENTKKINTNITTIKQEINKINNSKQELTQKIQQFKEIEESKAKQELENLMKTEKQFEVEKHGYNTEIETINKIIATLNTEIQQKLETKKNIAEQKKLRNWLDEYFINLVSVIEKNVMLKIYNEFNELFQKWFNILIEDETINVRLDEEFTPLIMQNGYETEIINLSGGEKTSCALAYRLALNKVINDVQSTINTKDIIILDEPTDGFSTEQLDKVRNVLEELNMQQVIIVSHESKIESFVENVIQIVKNEHISSVVN